MDNAFNLANHPSKCRGVTRNVILLYREQTALHKACTFGSANIVEMLIEATVQVHGREMVQDVLKTEDIEGNTPLLLAVESGSPEITR